MGDNRLFTERVIEGRPDVLMALLVDMSGSMAHGSKLPTAQRLAQLMLWALHDQAGVATRIWGHTGDNYDGLGADIYRLWEPGDPLTRLGLIDALEHGNNYDSWAIQYCVSQMVEEPQPQKVLVVLSDGLPAGSQYGGTAAANHVLQVTDWARQQGINVIQVALGDDLQMADQIAMFRAENIIPYTSEAALPRQLTNVLDRWT
jgi:nitric oxide reductase activation protein